MSMRACERWQTRDDDRDLAALRLVDRDRVGEAQGRGLAVGDDQRAALVAVDDDRFLLGVVLAEEDDRAVHQAQLVRVAGLDQAVADPEALAQRRPAVGIETYLKTLVECVDPDRSPVHRRQHLHVADRVDAEALRRPLGDDLDHGVDRALRVGSVDQEEVAFLVGLRLEPRRQPPVDRVGGGGDHRARRLAEDLGEANHRRDPGLDQILERLAGADRRQLVGVANEDDVGGLGEAAKQDLHRSQVQHRRLVDDDEFDRHRMAGLEGRFAPRNPLQHAVDRLRLVAGRLLQPPGGAPGRRAESDRSVGPFRLGDDRPGAGGLAYAGAAGQD